MISKRYFERLAEHGKRIRDSRFEATAYHQLGRIAEEQRNFGAAEQWHKKTLAIDEKQGNEHGAAGTYHQLGVIAQEQRDFDAANLWFKKALEIKEKQGEHGAASTYHQLGMIAQEQRDFDAADLWFKKALEIKEKQGNEHGMAITYGQLGNIALLQGDFESAGHSFIRSLVIFVRYQDRYHNQMTFEKFMLCYQQAPIESQLKMRELWEQQTELGPFQKPGQTETNQWRKQSTLFNNSVMKMLSAFLSHLPGINRIIRPIR